MAISVPYNPVPQESPARAPIPELSPVVTEEAFGSSIAQAIGGLGREAEKIGDQIFQRAIALQDLENQTMATEADNQFMLESAKVHAEFQSLEGQNAGPKALEKYTQDLSKIRADIGKGLGNPVARRLYDRGTRNTLARSIFNAAGHSAAQMKRANGDALAARVDLSMQDFSADPNQETFDARFGPVAADVIRLGDLHGWSREKTESEIAKVRGKARVEQIRGMAQREPFAAEKLYNEVKDEIHWTQQDSVQNLVQGGTANVKARFIDDEVNADLKTGEPDEKKGVEERVREAREKAAKESKDPLLGDYAAQRARATYNQYLQDKRDNVQRNDQTMLGGINGYTNPGGRVYNSRDDLYAFGTKEEIAIYDAASPKERKKYDTWMAKNAKGEVILTPERRAKYEELLGLSEESPVEFMTKDIMAEDLTKEQQQKLFTRRDQILKSPGKDPRISRAMMQVAPTLQAMGITPQDDKQAFLRFRGALSDLMRQEEASQKKPLTTEQIDKLSSRILQTIKTPGYIWGDIWPNKAPMFNLEVPESEANRIKNSPAWISAGVDPTDEQIQRIYFLERYNKLYGAQRSGDKPTGVGHQ